MHDWVAEVRISQPGEEAPQPAHPVPGALLDCRSRGVGGCGCRFDQGIEPGSGVPVAIEEER